uniref:Uncharacterized protein n=1 Tax=Knipowitschia caucasica TaxID=637954 RepID=A0AAV2KW71_KNICA
MANPCCGLKRVPVRGCRRKCPGTSGTKRFCQALQQPAPKSPTPPRAKHTPSPNRGTDPAKPKKTMTAIPTLVSIRPRQSSAPWGIGIMDLSTQHHPVYQTDARIQAP